MLRTEFVPWADAQDVFVQLFMVAVRPQNLPEVFWWRTYAHLLYLLVGFPVSLVSLGFSLGVGLAVLVFGLPILMLTVLFVWGNTPLLSALWLTPCLGSSSGND
ncbi:MAG: hypothetical protein ACK41E_07560 [Deinococcales bacterium]